MNIKECIDSVDSIKPNQYTVKEKVDWLSFLDETIINDVLKTHEGYDGRYENFSGYSEERITERLIVPSPYDRMYPAYIKMRIDGENGESVRYNNSAVLFNAYLSEYKKYYNKTHLPIDTVVRPSVPTVPLKKDAVTDAIVENIKRDVYALLNEELLRQTSADKIYDVVMNYVNNNTELLRELSTEDKKRIAALETECEKIGLLETDLRDIVNLPVKALGGTTVGGVDSLAGQRGYYIQSLDLVNHKFYISKTRVENPSLTEHSVDTAFQEEPFYQVGDRFSFISGNHYDFCGRITSINHNEITYEAGTVFIDSAGEEFSEFVDSPLEDDNTFFVPSKAEIGAVEIKNVGLAFGTRCISGGRDSFATGVDVIAGGDFSFATGNEVTTGYNDFGFGFDSHIHGYWNAGGGRQVNVDGRYSWGFGYETLVKAVAAGAFGQGTQALSDHQFVIGRYNLKDASGKYLLIVGNGTVDSAWNITRSNAFTVDKDGNGWFAGSISTPKNLVVVGNANISKTLTVKDLVLSGKSVDWGNVTSLLIGQDNEVGSGNGIVCLGYQNKAMAGAAAALGAKNNAAAYAAFVAGEYAEARKMWSASLGFKTIADSNNQFVTGKYNEIDSDGKYARIVGNGTDKKSSNAYTLDWKGNGWFAGNVTVGKDKQLLATQEFAYMQAEPALEKASDAMAAVEDMAKTAIRTDADNIFTGSNEFSKTTVFTNEIQPAGITAYNADFTLSGANLYVESDNLSFTTFNDINFRAKDGSVNISIGDLVTKIEELEARIAELEGEA